MTPWLEDPDVTLFHGDCLEVLRQLPDRSVHMCATSPPFFGLRDYGTGEWEGGDPDCDHAVTRPDKGSEVGLHDTETHDRAFRSTKYAHNEIVGRDCRCGARRVDQQIGLEETPDQWVERLVDVFREVRRVLRDDGTLWVEIGDSFNSGTSARRKVSNVHDSRSQYAEDSGAERINAPGMKTKDLLGQPWLLAFALRADGWYLRSEIIWARPNPMPESVTDRPTKSHSTVFLLSKRPRYFYDADAIREPQVTDDPSNPGYRPSVMTPHGAASNDGVRKPGADTQQKFRVERKILNPAGANARSVWQIPTEPTPYAHFATWPQALVRRMILAGTSEKGCCPKCGAPWVREKELGERPPNAYAGRYQHNLKETGKRQDIDSLPRGDYIARPVLRSGWSPSCDHHGKVWEYEPVPCTVLDPFAGSGTTALVARNHGRHSIGIELNQAYLEIAAKRLQQLSLLA